MANRRSASDLVRAARAKALTLPREGAEAVTESASRVEDGRKSATVADVAVLGAILRTNRPEIYREIA